MAEKTKYKANESLDFDEVGIYLKKNQIVELRYVSYGVVLLHIKASKKRPKMKLTLSINDFTDNFKPVLK